MADIRVRSTDGNNADNGSTWLLGKADLHTATTGGLAAAGAGGTCYVSQAHAQSTAAAITLTSPGTADAPTRVICSNDGADPPTSVATTAQVITTGASSINIAGGMYAYGMTFSAGTGSTSASILFSVANSAQAYEACNFVLDNSGNSSGRITVEASASNNCYVKWQGCGVSFLGTAQGILINRGTLEWVGGSILAGSTAQTAGLFRSGGLSGNFLVRDVDLSNLGSSADLCATSYSSPGTGVFYNCKLPASWTGQLGTVGRLHSKLAMYNCDSGDTNYRLWIEQYSGSIRDETTLVMSGGATDGTTPISWKMTTNANANENLAVLVSDPISEWRDSVGSAVTVSVEILHDSATALTDAQVWLEVECLGTSGYPLGVVATDQRATQLASAAAQTSSSATWTTTGMSNPRKQVLSVSVMPQEKGLISARVVLGTASKTIYVNPELSIS